MRPPRAAARASQAERTAANPSPAFQTCERFVEPRDKPFEQRACVDRAAAFRGQSGGRVADVRRARSGS